MGIDKRAYLLCHFGKEYRFVCLPFDVIEVEENTIFLYRGGNLIAQIDRGDIGVFYYTEPAS